jgi:hypothetical protein
MQAAASLPDLPLLLSALAGMWLGLLARVLAAIAIMPVCATRLWLQSLAATALMCTRAWSRSLRSVLYVHCLLLVALAGATWRGCLWAAFWALRQSTWGSCVALEVSATA